MNFNSKSKFIVMTMIITLTSFLCFASDDLKIYTENSPPDQFLDNNGKLTGLYIDVVNEIQKRLGTNYSIHMVPWARGYHILQSEPNVILFSMARNAERNSLFQWVGPVTESTFGFYAKADSKLVIKNLDDAKKVKRIGVYRDDVRDQYLTKAGFNNLFRSSDNKINYKRTLSGELDAFCGSSLTIDGALKEAGLESKDYKLLYGFTKTQVYIAFSLKTPKETVKKWNDAFESMKNDGTFKTIFKKYYPKSELPGPAITDFK